MPKHWETSPGWRLRQRWQNILIPKLILLWGRAVWWVLHCFAFHFLAIWPSTRRLLPVVMFLFRLLWTWRTTTTARSSSMPMAYPPSTPQLDLILCHSFFASINILPRFLLCFHLQCVFKRLKVNLRRWQLDWCSLDGNFRTLGRGDGRGSHFKSCWFGCVQNYTRGMQI